MRILKEKTDVVINNDGTLKDTATSNISNITTVTTVTTVITIIVTTVNGGSSRVASRAPGTVSFFLYYFKLQVTFKHAWQPYDHQHHEHEHDDHHHQQY